MYSVFVLRMQLDIYCSYKIFLNRFWIFSTHDKHQALSMVHIIIIMRHIHLYALVGIERIGIIQEKDSKSNLLVMSMIIG